MRLPLQMPKKLAARLLEVLQLRPLLLPLRLHSIHIDPESALPYMP